MMRPSYDDVVAVCCPMCNIKTERVLARKLRRGTGIVFYCHPCDLGFLFQNKIQDLQEYYARDYRQQASHRADGAATNPEEIYEAYHRYQIDRVRLVEDAVGGSLVDSVLEIGASAGQFLRRVSFHGARKCAIEFDPACCEFMRRMDIEADTRPLAQSTFRYDKFDVVCAFQVIEHTDNPVKFLTDIKSVLKPGGVAVIECPNLHDALRGIWGLKEYNDFYFHADHRFYFTGRSLKALAKAAGFAKPEIRFTQDYSILNHLHWLMNRAPQPDCHVGLGPVKFGGSNRMISDWLTGELRRLNEEYVARLTSTGTTSNITLIVGG